MWFFWLMLIYFFIGVLMVVWMEIKRKNAHKSTVSKFNENIKTENVVFDFKGANGRLVVCDDKILILKDSVLGDYSNSMATNKSIPMQSIKSVQVQQTFIQFGVLGDRNASSGTSGAYYDENSIILKNREQLNEALKIKKYIENCISEKKSSEKETANSISAADEILKFKQLLDIGAITEEEFEAKKKQLLGL